MVGCDDPFAPHTVQLRHELPDGSSHVDWMIDLEQREESRLLTFRASRRIDEVRPGERLELERLADHRRRYLDYEGPISGDRGRVIRLAAGRIEAMQSLGDCWGLLIVWRAIDQPGGRRQWILLRPAKGGRWIVDVRSVQ